MTDISVGCGEVRNALVCLPVTQLRQPRGIEESFAVVRSRDAIVSTDSVKSTKMWDCEHSNLRSLVLKDFFAATMGLGTKSGDITVPP
jgi:hypothetical protein